MTPRDLHGLIEVYAGRHGIPADLGAALVYHESKGIYWASRFEEKWFAAKLLILPTKRLAGYVPKSGTPSIYDEKVWRAHSWGLCQVMGDRARIMGFDDDFLPKLISCPELSLDYGFKHLRKCIGETPLAVVPAGAGSPFGSVMERSNANILRAISGLLRYNGGGDPEYDDKVLSVLYLRSYYKMIGWEANV